MDDLSAVYLSRRLAETRRVESLAASIRFDLARSGLDDDQLETAVNAFSQQEKPSTGWGWSTVLDDLMTREPKRVPVTDMQAFQNNLINLGYASPLTVATGVWDPSWYGASRRYDRDIQEGQMAGKTMLAAPLRQGIELLGQTMPSNIYRNIVGWAKGFYEQTPETVGRVGAIGGAVAGAAIGAIAGAGVLSAPGALIGGAIGGTIGFFGDLLGDDEEEGDQSWLESFADALTPFEEYAGNSKAFFEDLGYVGTIASVIGGAAVAKGLVTGSVEGIGSSLAAKGAADVQLGLPGSIARWATKQIAPDSLEAVSAAIARVSPIAHMAKFPAAKMVNGIFTGASTASVGIHLTAGLGQGANKVNEGIREQAAALVQASTESGKPLTQEELELIDQAAHGVGVGTIEKAIAETDVPYKLGSLNMGPQVLGMPISDWLLPANMLDIGSFFLWPQKLFPVVPGSIGKAFGAAVDTPLTGRSRGIAESWAAIDGAESMKRDWILYFTGDGMSVKQARAFVDEHVTPGDDQFYRLQAEMKNTVARQLRDEGVDMAQRDIAYSQKKYDLIEKMRAEGETGRSSTAFGMYTDTVQNGNTLLAHMEDTLPPGTLRTTAFLNHQKAQGLAEKLTAKLRDENNVTDVFMAGAKGTSRKRLVGIDEGTMVVPYGKITMQHDAAALERQAGRLEAQAARLRDAQFSPGAPIQTITDSLSKAEELSEEAAKLRRLIEAGGKETVARTAAQHLIVPVRLNTPSRADLYEMLRKYHSYRQKLDALVTQSKKAKAGAETPGFGSPQYMHLHQELSDLVETWRGLGILGEGKFADELQASALGIKTNKRMSNFLTARAKAAFVDADVPTAVRAEMQPLGYKPGITGENLIAGPQEAKKWIEVNGIGDYTRRRSFYEMIGFREKVDLDKRLAGLRNATEQAELGDVARRLGINRTPADIYRKISDHLKATNNDGHVWGPAIWGGGKTGAPKLFKIDIRQLKPKDIRAALEDILPEGREAESALDIYGALKRGAAFGGEWRGQHPVTTARALGRALRVSGLPGFSDLVRTWHLEDPLLWESKGVSANLMSKAKYSAVGAGVGAAVGATSGDQGTDIFAGAAIGAGVGLATRGFAGRAYGYLPDALVRANLALRYTLSLTFDAGRYSEQAMLGMMQHNIPPGATFAPKHFSRSGAPAGGWTYKGQKVAPEEAWPKILEHWDEINGGTWLQNLDETERRMFQAGLLGFSPRNVEAMQAWILMQRGMAPSEIEKAVKGIGRYGMGRSAAEKSVNFIFFPFSFSKKLLTTLGDFAIQAPGRNLLIYEGFRRYYESTLDEDFHALIEDHLPLLEQLSKVNNLTYGLSPGRFFFKGVGDQRTNAGKAAFILSQFFAPSGAATPLAQSFGAAGDLAINAFVPVVFTGESIDRLGGIDGVNDIVGRYIPLVREVTQYWNAVNEQKTAVLEGETPWAQVQDYLDQKREFTDGLRPMAAMMGFASPENFLSSNAGAPWKAQYDALGEQLNRDYPSAESTLGGFESDVSRDKQILYELANKQEKGAGELAILGLQATIETYERMKALGFLPSGVADRIESTAVREIALKHVEDRRFQELYALLYMRAFGPLEVAA